MYVYARAVRGQRGIISPGAGASVSCDLSDMGTGHLGPLQERQALLATEPSISSAQTLELLNNLPVWFLTAFVGFFYNQHKKQEEVPLQSFMLSFKQKSV